MMRDRPTAQPAAVHFAILRFADCALDRDARRLTRGGREVRLSPKAFALLGALIDEAGRAVSKVDLLERVWPGVFVSDASLARTITELRNAIGDDARTMIRTVHGFGYAFDAAIHGGAVMPATPRDAPVLCWLVTARRSHALADGEHVIGRDEDTSVALDSSKVSRRHARIVVSGTKAILEDLGSKNGTFVGDMRTAAPMPLTAGDEVRIGPFILTFRVTRGPSSTETDTLPRAVR